MGQPAVNRNGSYTGLRTCRSHPKAASRPAAEATGRICSLYSPLCHENQAHKSFQHLAAWGRSFGAEGIRIKSEAEVAPAIDGAFAVKTKPVVVHCRISALLMSAWRRYTRLPTLP